jgi:hypothetical protein
MQASTDSLDNTVELNTGSRTEQVESSLARLPAPAPDESKTDSFIPYTLDTQQEDNLSISMIKLYEVCYPF